jgi:hypothetical protein
MYVKVKLSLLQAMEAHWVARLSALRARDSFLFIFF